MDKKQANTKPVEKKQVETKKKDPIWDAEGFEEFYNNQLSISADLKEEMRSQGLDWRFINQATFRKSGNRHKNLWRPYNVKARSPIDAFSGIDPEGVLTRGDLVLAVRPKKVTEAYKAKVDARNRANAGYNKQKAQEMRQMAKEAGVDMVVEDSYDDGKAFQKGSYRDAE